MFRLLLVVFSLLISSCSVSAEPPSTPLVTFRDKLKEEREVGFKVITLESIAPYAWRAIDDLKKGHDYLTPEALMITHAELRLWYSERCSSSSAEKVLKDRRYWYLVVSPKAMGEGGGACLFLDALNGKLLHYSLAE